MQGFKKSPLTLWLEHYGYNRNKKKSLKDSQSPNVNDSICCDTNEDSLPSNNGTNGSLYPDDLPSVNYPEYFSDITYTDESASQSLYGAMSDSPGSDTLLSMTINGITNFITAHPFMNRIPRMNTRKKDFLTLSKKDEVLFEVMDGREEEAEEPLERENQNNELSPRSPPSALSSQISSTLSSELKTVCSTVSTSALIASSDVTSEIQEENIDKCKLDQVSKFCDGDEGIDIHKSYCTTVTKMVHYLVSSVTFRIFGIMLIFLDIFLMAIDLHLYDSNFHIPLGYRSLSFAIALFFLVDVLLRVYVEGRQNYFSDLLNTLDAVVIGVTLLIALTYILYDKKFLKDIPRLAVLFRPLRLLILIRILQLAHQKRHLEKLTRQLVSKNKRRFKKDGFDLDLTYVTDRIIAMSFPSSGGQSFYRNPIDEVVRFLDSKHPDHYQVYNLCSESAYDPKNFHYRVRRIMVDDHNVPTLEEMLLFSKEVNDWMGQHPENIVAIHCMGGKGRTGTMVCACLLAGEIVLNAKESLYIFGERRTDKSCSSKFQGIETPSQNRYVKYFEKVKVSYQSNLPPRKLLVIKRFIIYSIHGVGKGDGSDLQVQIIMWQETIFSCFSSKNCMIFHDVETDRVIIDVFNCPVLHDDVKVKFLSSNLPKYYDDCAFFFWFHTAFIRKNRLYLPRNELDNPHKQKTWNIYSPNFAVQVFFEDM